MDDERGLIASYAAAEGLPPIDWSLGAVAALWPTLDHLRRQGLVVVIKLDGERQSDEFTVVITSAALGDGPWTRREAADIETALVGALADFLRPGWARVRSRRSTAPITAECAGPGAGCPNAFALPTGAPRRERCHEPRRPTSGRSGHGGSGRGATRS